MSWEIYYTEDAAVSKSNLNEYDNVGLGVFVRNILVWTKNLHKMHFPTLFNLKILGIKSLCRYHYFLLTKNGTIDKSMLFEPI